MSFSLFKLSSNGFMQFISKLLIFFNFILMPLPFDFLSKNLKTIDASPRWYPSYLGSLAILNAFSLKTLSAAVFFAKSLKSPQAISC